MNWRRVTVGLIVATAIVWIAWDVVVGATHHDTESAIIAAWARAVNALPLTLGALVAHWCWQNRRPRYDWWPLALACLVAALAWDALTGSTFWPQVLHVPAWSRHPGLWLFLGLPVGHWFWPQRYPEVK